MMNEGPQERGYDLISRALSSVVLTVRDDQFEFPWLIDAARLSRSRGGRFRVIDSGRNDIVSLGRLSEAGAEVYSSDEARPDPMQLIPVVLFGRKSGSPTFYYIHGPLAADPKTSEVGETVLEFGRTGGDIHLSNRERTRSVSQLLALAEACRPGRGRLVYYHFGRLDPQLEDLAAEGGWIHGLAQELDTEAAEFLILDILHAGRRSGAGFILHVEKAGSTPRLRRVFEAGAFLEFHTAPAESSPDRSKLEAESERRRPDARAFYLHTDFLP